MEIIVAGADNRINFKIEGNGKIVGLIMVMQLILIVIRELHEKPFRKALVIVQSTKMRDHLHLVPAVMV